jgi:hypothetical protein
MAGKFQHVSFLILLFIACATANHLCVLLDLYLPRWVYSAILFRIEFGIFFLKNNYDDFTCLLSNSFHSSLPIGAGPNYSA